MSRKAKFIRVGSRAFSALEIEVGSGHDPEFDSADMAVLARHLTRSQLKAPTTAADADAMANALTELANTYDDTAHHAPVEERADARYTRDSLTELSRRVRRWPVG